MWGHWHWGKLYVADRYALSLSFSLSRAIRHVGRIYLETTRRWTRSWRRACSREERRLGKRLRTTKRSWFCWSRFVWFVSLPPHTTVISSWYLSFLLMIDWSTDQVFRYRIRLLVDVQRAFKEQIDALDIWCTKFDAHYNRRVAPRWCNCK